MSPRPAVQRRVIPGSPFNAQREAAKNALERFEVDDRVTHDRHGMGRVVDVDAESCVVDFAGVRRRVTLAGGKLHKL